MRIPRTAPLFSWEHLDDQPDLKTLRRLLDEFPDRHLMAALKNHRGHGRNDYPIAVLWRTHLASIFLRHPFTESTLAELRRNEGLCRVIGIDSPQQVPTPPAMSRFLAVLGRPEFRALMRAMFDTLVRQLGQAVPDLGQHTAGDSTHLQSKNELSDADAAEIDSTNPPPLAPQGLPQPAYGVKEYKDDQGKISKVVKWFGFKLHLLVDVTHEIPLAFEITGANAPDNQHIAPLLEQAEQNLPASRIETLAYDKAADDVKVHELCRRHRIKPLIQLRKNPHGPKEELVPNRQGLRQFVYNDQGDVLCYDTLSEPPIQRPMAFHGYDSANDTLKYRCPAKAFGFTCKSLEKCNGASEFGKTIRISPQLDPRRFPEIPRATKTFERLYKGRTAVERVFAREKVLFKIDDTKLSGSGRYIARVETVLLAQLALGRLLASVPRDEPSASTLGRARLSPIAQRLEAAIREQSAAPTAAS